MKTLKHGLLFLAFAALSLAQAVDFSVTTSGAHHVVKGHSLFFLATGTVISGTNENATPAVTGLPAGTTVSFPNLAKFCCTTFLWTIDSLNPIRVDTTAATPAGAYTLNVIYTSQSGVIRFTTYPIVVDPVPVAPSLPASWPPDVPLAGLAQYETNMTTYGAKHCVPSELTQYEGFHWYYDGQRVMLQIRDYTKDSKWHDCAIAVGAFYSQLVLARGGNMPGYEVFPKGLARWFLEDGAAAGKTALLSLVTTGPYVNLTSAPNANMGRGIIDWSSSREVSYGIESHLAAKALGTPLSPDYATLVDLLFGHFDQWFVSKIAAYVQPFMVGLGAEALIDHFDETGDPRVIATLKLAADQLWNVSWDKASQSFWYYNNGGNQTSPVDANCFSLATPCRIQSPDLNLLIVPLFGWVYQHTGIKAYREIGDQIFNSGVAGAYLEGGKQFSQNYRLSMKYLLWRLHPQPASVPGYVWIDQKFLPAQCSTGSVGVKSGSVLPCTVN